MAPNIILPPSFAVYISEVSRWRPVGPQIYLFETLDLLRDIGRLINVHNAALRQAKREALQVVQTFVTMWNTHPALKIQRLCTDRKSGFYVRLFWTTVIAAMALGGSIISYYELDDAGVTVHEPDGKKKSSSWTNIAQLCKELQIQSRRPRPRTNTPEPENVNDMGFLQDTVLSQSFRGAV